MKVQRAAPANELFAKLLFLIAPTAALACYLLYRLYSYGHNQIFEYISFNDSVVRWTLLLTAGMAGSALFHAFRFRALVPFIALIVLFWMGYKGINLMATEE